MTKYANMVVGRTWLWAIAICKDTDRYAFGAQGGRSEI